jgi:hypoxanthine phosphoribosyltransferase
VSGAGRPGFSATPPKELLAAESIARRVRELSGMVERDFAPGPFSFIAVACGGMVFSADLMRGIGLPMTLDIIFAKSYEGSASCGVVSTTMSLRHPVEGMDVLLVDDILDSGRTLSKLVQDLKGQGAASIRTCVLLDKPSRRVVDFKADYVGFEIPDAFVVGYGLDFDGYYRNLPYIGAISS